MTDGAQIGLKRGTVKVVDYNPTWPELFIKEKQDLLAALGGKIHGVEHIGSTAVPGLSAKPIIDIIASVDSLDDYKELVKSLISLGYEFMPERIFVDRVFFPKGSQDNRTHHLSLVVKDSPGWYNPIRFRDYLANHPEARNDYQVLKQELARKYADDRASYTKGKELMIEEIMQKAGK